MAQDVKVAVIGASGRVGRRLVAQLAGAGSKVIAIGRSAERLAGLNAATRIADLNDADALARALAGADRVASCAHARFAPAVLAALPRGIERVVLTGSTRRFTRFADAASAEVAAAETALAVSGRPGVIVHPTMICGPDGENNVQRVAAYIRRFGVVPLPKGGRALIQPIYVDDVARSLAAALFRAEAIGSPIVAAGPSAIAYRDFVVAIAEAIGRRVRILDMPAGLLVAAAAATRFLPGVPRIDPAEVRRLLEDKAFDIGPMRTRLGVEPLGIAETLARSLA
jgi:uncharacterized protein YbjT (DUF2867 family)